MKPGDTLAVGMLKAVLDKYGRDILIVALSCITQTRRGNVGMIRKQIVEALCSVLEAEPDLAKDQKALIFRMQSFDFAAQFSAASTKSIASGEKVSAVLIEAIGEHLEAAPAAAPAAQTTRALPPAPVPAKAAAAARQITGNLSIGRDDISRGGQRVKVGPRAALLVAALAKAKPNCIGDDFLIGKIWTQRPANAIEILDQLVRELGCLKQLGLEVRTQRGIGRQLVDVA